MAPSIRHLRWLVPLALVVTAVVVISLVQAIRYSDAHDPAHAGDPTTIASPGFFHPKSTTPVSFSLGVLQAAGAASMSSPPTSPRRVTMRSLLGKPLVLNMWASTCSVCMTETPDIEAASRRLDGRVEFVGIDTLDQRSPALRLLDRYHVSYLQLFDPNESVGSGYGIPGLPVTVFVSPAGRVKGEYLGALDSASIAHYLKVLFGVRS